MTLLTWNHACTVGIKAMDDQHGILMDTMNDVRVALAEGRSRDEVSAGLNRLIDFTRMHFSCEERLLEQHGFPHAAEHREAHQRLLVEIEEAAQRTQYREDVHLRSLLIFLRDWYMTHIEGLDSEYGVWLSERGIS